MITISYSDNIGEWSMMGEMPIVIDSGRDVWMCYEEGILSFGNIHTLYIFHHPFNNKNLLFPDKVRVLQLNEFAVFAQHIAVNSLEVARNSDQQWLVGNLLLVKIHNIVKIHPVVD